MPDIEDRNPSESKSEDEPRESNVRRSESESVYDQSEDELRHKAIGGYGGDTGEFAARWAPSSKSND